MASPFFLLRSQAAMMRLLGFTDAVAKNLLKTREKRLLRCEPLILLVWSKQRASFSQ